MRIGLMGGSFDPPHLSHKAIIDFCLKHKLVDEVWVLPAYDHTQKSPRASFEHRMRMSKMLFCKWFSHKVEVLDEEKFNPRGYTLRLVHKFQRRYLNDEFKLIVGLDCANNIKSWYQWRMLIKAIPFIVINRGLTIPKESWFDKEPHEFYKVEECFCSSSVVRKYCKGKHWKSLKQCVGPKVQKYIIKEGLYEDNSG